MEIIRSDDPKKILPKYLDLIVDRKLNYGNAQEFLNKLVSNDLRSGELRILRQHYGSESQNTHIVFERLGFLIWPK